MHTWNLPCDRLGILSISSILPQILPQTSSQTQGKQRVSRMEHQTPSVFPGNFRKRKVLGPLCFPFCLPEKYIQEEKCILQAKLFIINHAPSGREVDNGRKGRKGVSVALTTIPKGELLTGFDEAHACKVSRLTACKVSCPLAAAAPVRMVRWRLSACGGRPCVAGPPPAGSIPRSWRHG